MQEQERLLVIGSSELSESVHRALPQWPVVALDTPLAALWALGQQPFRGVIVSLGTFRPTLPALRWFRQVARSAPVVLVCAAAEEPEARRVVSAGFDEYVIEPVTERDLRLALGMPKPTSMGSPSPAAGPTFQEIAELGEILRTLGEGLGPALRRFAALLQSAFASTGASVCVGEEAAGAGDTSDAVLEQPLRRGEEVIGRIQLARRADGPYVAADAARLSDYAHLIETIEAQVREQARWQELAWRDDLCGLRNRRYFAAMLRMLIDRAGQERRRLTVVLFDIDNFKQYNDSYGHETGDALLREVAALLTRCSRQHDVVARYGGDEFAVILWDAGPARVPGSQHPADAASLAARFGTVIREHQFQCLGEGAPGPVTLSGGLACFPWDGGTAQEIMRAADAALLQAKRTGRDRIALADGGPAPVAEATAEEEQAGPGQAG